MSHTEKEAYEEDEHQGSETVKGELSGDIRFQSSSSKVRKSHRINKGKMPDRLGEWNYDQNSISMSDGNKPKNSKDISEGNEEDQGVSKYTTRPATVSQKMHRVSTRVSMKSSRSGASGKTAASVIKREKAMAELDAELELAELEDQLEQKRLNRVKILVQKKLALRLAEIDDNGKESESDYVDSEDERSDGRSSPRQDYFDWLNGIPKSAKFMSTPAKPLVFNPQPSQQNLRSITNPASQNVTPGNQTTYVAQQGGLEKFVVRQAIGRDLPQFSGDPTEWLSFKAQYEEMTKLCGFSDAENWCRLQKSLRGRAKDSVQSLLSVPGNVTKIMSILERRYGRPELIIETILEKAKKTTVAREDRPETLIELADVIENAAATIDILGRKSYLSNPFLVKELLSKLPPNLRIKWGEHAVTNKLLEPNLSDLSEWISRIADFACAIRSTKVQDIKVTGGVSTKTANVKETVLAASDAVNTPKDSEPRKKCTFCMKTNHNLASCWKFQKEDLDKKWDHVKKGNLCYSCLEGSHLARNCKQRKLCDEANCSRWHHKLLHQPEEIPKSQPKSTVETTTHTISAEEKNTKALLSVLPVTIEGPNGKVKTHALLDWGSTITLIDESLANELQLEGLMETFSLKTLAAQAEVEKSKRVKFKISGVNSSNTYLIERARTVSELRLPLHTVDVDELKRKWDHLKNLDLPTMDSARPLLLIGQDNGHLLAAKEASRMGSNGPIATRTVLGWVLHGRPSYPPESVNEDFILHADEDEMLHKMVKDFFRTETFGVKVINEKSRSKEDDRAQVIMDATTRRIGDRWETGLLWRNEQVILPESKSMALKRLYGIERRMDRDREFASNYVRKIEDYIAKGYVHKLSPDEATKEDQRTWYLPHFGVVNENKPNKLRLVFDAAAVSNGVSLNSALVTGPDLFNSLVGVLSRFRQYKIAFTADIKEMFHQVKIREKDLSSQRFLWRAQDRNRPPDVFQMDVMIFGAVCSPCSAQDVKNRNAREFEIQYPEAAKAIIEKHYMDDYLDSKDSENAAIKIIQEVIYIHSKGGFTICNWICNSESVRMHIPEELRAKENTDVNMDTELKTERVLGLHWNPKEDLFTFKFKANRIPASILKHERSPTKREVLRIVMALYDPLGFLSFFIVKAKILLQDIWRTDLGWDDELTTDLCGKWEEWLLELQNIGQVKISRCFTGHVKVNENRQLHCYCDASEKAFAAVIYIRSESESGILTALVCSKARVAPLKPMSIPRLELQAALLGARLMDSVKKELEFKISGTYFWTDSRTVLCWLRSDSRRFKTFVSHRIGEISELTHIQDWNWVPTKFNAADLATRNCKPCEFTADNWWWTGPDYLRNPEVSWPKEEKISAEQSVESLECKEEYAAVITELDPWILDFTRFSKLLKLKRTMAWIIRFVENCHATKGNRKSGELQADELNSAETVLIRRAQQESFPLEWKNLKNGNPGVPKDSDIYTLSPYMDSEDILRIRGRVEHSKMLSEETRRPIILDRKHPYTVLVLKFYHEQAGHNGHEKVVNEVRQKFWIPHIRAAVRSTWSSCQECKNKRVKPIVTEMGALPECRLDGRLPPFTHCGLDYFGPLEVTIGRRREKRYGALFTCMVTRAIHVEIAHSMSTDSAIMAIRRMIARRGAPSHIYCDNGTNFRGAEREIRESIAAMDQDRILRAMSIVGVQWHFNPPASPHMGGAWERMVRSVKTALYATLKEKAPREETLATLMAEAEFTVNSRPLTHVSIDKDDPEALTPNHFLTGGSRPSMMGEFSDADLNLRKQWRLSQRLSDKFWRRWLREYLPSLTRRSKWHKTEGEVRLGSIVVVADPNLPRNTWPLGIIEELFPGKDGKSRVVAVRTSTGVYRRPMGKICLLDVKSHSGVHSKNDTPGGSMLARESMDEK